jgi:hypothetical protein
LVPTTMSAGNPDVTSQTWRSRTETTVGAAGSAWPISSGSTPSGAASSKEQRRLKLEAVEQPVRDGSLTIRAMTPEERKKYPKPAPVRQAHRLQARVRRSFKLSCRRRGADC